MFATSAARKGDLQTFTCDVVCKRKIVPIVAMLDCGSVITCIDEDLALGMKLKQLTPKSTKSLRYLDRSCPITTQCVEVNLQNTNASVSMTLIAWTIPNLSESTHVRNWNTEKSRFKHLANLDFPRIAKHSRIELLIGTNYPDMFVPYKYRKGKPGEPVAIKTLFGWTVIGGKSCTEIDMAVRNEFFTSIYSNMGFNITTFETEIETT